MTFIVFDNKWITYNYVVLHLHQLQFIIKLSALCVEAVALTEINIIRDMNKPNFELRTMTYAYQPAGKTRGSKIRSDVLNVT